MEQSFNPWRNNSRFYVSNHSDLHLRLSIARVLLIECFEENLKMIWSPQKKFVTSKILWKRLNDIVKGSFLAIKEIVFNWFGKTIEQWGGDNL